MALAAAIFCGDLYARQKSGSKAMGEGFDSALQDFMVFHKANNYWLVCHRFDIYRWQRIRKSNGS